MYLCLAVNSFTYSGLLISLYFALYLADFFRTVILTLLGFSAFRSELAARLVKAGSFSYSASGLELRLKYRFCGLS